ncbi:ATP-dependent sacrificial sulfur transferase LarE [Pseudoflavonifractor sp. MSJ-30]|uniref:ATP-dependent sacrificial sulfur transferase LarE n=1 Tax=Pseudoflavonifractor sp. MSJ-30 TaxID=2841525 RepID=UPI001C120C75|nr:ATP-dependent sacrificial sulfur transferase LarE [Pseudoflavonifractor sp. MSJ-30]MBU5453089.1 ATP-dependent sacrificial sulfur transferase LarE [Pseudoflavonifractor sp. MSJ-30]
MTLEAFFKENPKTALAFSGGVDSSYLLCAAMQAGAEVRAYYVKTAFQPEFEYEDAMRLAKQLGVEVTVLRLDALCDPQVAVNPANRCYYCKQNIFGSIWRAARADGFSVLLDGTNASDQADDRPGMKALRELKVRSPLREAGLTKAMIREKSRLAGLFTWDKPAYACLATRIPTGETITEEKLTRTEWAESYLMGLGFSDLRVRLLGSCARVQLPKEQQEAFLDRREEILAVLKTRYSGVLLDMEARDGR